MKEIEVDVEIFHEEQRSNFEANLEKIELEGRSTQEVQCFGQCPDESDTSSDVGKDPKLQLEDKLDSQTGKSKVSGNVRTGWI